MSGVDSENLVEIGTYRQSNDEVKPTAGILDEECARLFIKTACKRIRELQEMVLDGFFYISAIRKPFTQSAIFEDDRAFHYLSELKNEDGNWSWPKIKALITSRDVSSQGEKAWPLERIFALNSMSLENLDKKSKQKMRFEGYISKWTETLLNTKVVVDETDAAGIYSTNIPASPIGFLLEERPKLAVEGEYEHYMGEASTEKLIHPCFPDQPQTPKQMSSGFHQLFPLIVQTGLMRKFEIMAIANF